MALIGKSLLGLIVLCTTYTLLMMAFPDASVSQNQNQTNYTKAEGYFYGDHSAKPVTIVGTSLSARLYTDSLPGFYNLAFGGMSVNDGLAIVNHSEQKPRLLLLETNLFWKHNSNSFLEPLFNPVNYYLRKFLISFRSDKQPVAFAIAGAIQGVKDIKRGGGRAFQNGGGQGSSFSTKRF